MRSPATLEANLAPTAVVTKKEKRKTRAQRRKTETMRTKTTLPVAQTRKADGALLTQSQKTAQQAFL